MTTMSNVRRNESGLFTPFDFPRPRAESESTDDIEEYTGYLGYKPVRPFPYFDRSTSTSLL